MNMIENLPELDFDPGLATNKDDADVITIPIIIGILIETALPVIV